MTTKIDHYAETNSGLLLIANGLEFMQRWDGLAAATVDAGLSAPLTAATLAGAGSGNIAGVYYGYARFLDSYGNPSNLSPISASFTAAGGSTGSVSNASFTAPIVVTSTGHGLSTGQVVNITGVQGNSATNGSWVITVLDANTFSLNGSSGNANYLSGGTWTSGIQQINWTNVPVPTEAKVTKRQLLRNTAGQATTFYVDLETTDLASTNFSTTNTDSQLSSNTSVPLFDSEGAVFANANGKPPNWKSVVIAHRDRMFALGEVQVTQGNVKVTSGSPTVLGVGTDWTSALAGRVLYVVGATAPYTISTVNTTTQTLTLSANYADATDQFALYAIRPQPGERRLLYWSLAGMPESWFPGNALAVEETGDEIVGGMTLGTFIYILEERHIHRFTYQTNPAVDGGLFLVSIRGCVNHRCAITVGPDAYLLDNQGVHILAGDESSDPTSEPVQQLFQPNFQGLGEDLGINWSAKEFFHAAHYPPEETIFWYVALAGDRFPRHAICYHYRAKAWWIEEMQIPVASSCTGFFAGSLRTFAGSRARNVLLMRQGQLDGPDPNAGTVRGTVTGAYSLGLTDSRANFASSRLIGNAVTIAEGKGNGQTRTIIAATSTSLVVDRVWATLPDTTSVYQVGGVPWTYLSLDMRYLVSEAEIPTTIETTWQPIFRPGTFRIQVLQDYGTTPVTFATTLTADEGEGMGVSAGDTDLVVDLTRKFAFAQQRLDRRQEANIPGPSHFAISASGVGTVEQIKLYSFAFNGVMPVG